MNTNNTFSERLRELRQQSKLLQKDLAKMLGYTQAYISAWERGLKEPDIKSILQLCKILQTSADYLLGNTDFE